MKIPEGLRKLLVRHVVHENNYWANRYCEAIDRIEDVESAGGYWAPTAEQGIFPADYKAEGVFPELLSAQELRDMGWELVVMADLVEVVQASDVSS